jgi:hypothetical protein
MVASCPCNRNNGQIKHWNAGIDIQYIEGVSGQLREMGWGGGLEMDRVHLAQDTDHWGALVHTVMNFRVP